MASPIFDHRETIRIERAAGAVFDGIADIDALFSSLQRRSPVEVVRLSGAGAAAVGDKWKVAGRLKIGRREGVVEITRLTRPSRIAFTTTGGGYLADTEVVIAPDGEAACALTARNRISANSLKARLVSPFVRLYRRRIEKGFRRILKKLKRRIET